MSFQENGSGEANEAAQDGVEEGGGQKAHEPDAEAGVHADEVVGAWTRSGQRFVDDGGDGGRGHSLPGFVRAFDLV